MDTARLSFFDMFDQRRVSSIAWPTLQPDEISEEKHLWLYNRRDLSNGSTATRVRITAFGLTSAGKAACDGKYVEARSDGIAGDPGVPFADDAQASFTPLGSSLLIPGAYLDIGDIPPAGGRRVIFRINLPPSFDEFGPAVIILTVGYREE